jgi:DNA primase
VTRKASAAAEDLDTLRRVTHAAVQILTAPARRPAADAYLRQRGVDPTALGPQWILGYAPPGWTRLTDTLAPTFGEHTLLQSGLARRSSRGTLIDTFRDRVIFGIRDHHGHLAGFIGRDLSGTPDTPKYMNTPRTQLFDKSRLLYGVHEGTTTGGQPVIVEGPLDVLAIAAAQPTDRHSRLIPIAACGTAFTDAHASVVASIARSNATPVVVAMDGDAAGRTAALRIGERLHDAGLEVRVAVLPSASDPADYLSRSDGRLQVFHAANGLPLLTLQVEHEIERQGDDMSWPEGRLRALRNLAPKLAAYPPQQTARQLAWIAQALSLHPSTVTLEVADAYRNVRPRDFATARGRSYELAISPAIGVGP